MIGNRAFIAALHKKTCVHSKRSEEDWEEKRTGQSENGEIKKQKDSHTKRLAATHKAGAKIKDTAE